MSNRQIPLEQAVAPRTVLQLHSIFPTIQGEGPFTGQPATFVRLYGCNLQCPLCDTEYTGSQVTMLVKEIVTIALNYKHELVVITGGEPFRQGIDALVTALLNEDFVVQIETNGTIFCAIQQHYNAVIVCSPKTATIEIPAHRIHAFKYVLHHKHIAGDGLPTFALGRPNENNLVARPPVSYPRDKIYVTPCDTGDPELNRMNLEAAIASCREFGYTLGLQIHKIINLP